MSDRITVTCLYDPLCGWCYGAHPALTWLRAHDDVALAVLPVGLFAGRGAFPMDAGFAAHAWSADQRIAVLTGQPFSEAYRTQVLESRAGPVDSGPATLALTAVRLTAPDREPDALAAVQAARYVGGRDIAAPGVLADILDEAGLAPAAARLRAADATLHEAAAARMAAGRAAMARHGLRGVPALVVGGGDGRGLDGAHLFGDRDALLRALLRALRGARR
ncbi:DsbA family protein [Methylobacterium platani]|uniref:Protein-disulfide isomerase n=2 Tax=Methylobacterium platani TaxID=427683 RepID=A0A179S9T2_9HYPH|nr:DsbA family protein [Methylobacterium platani]KMO19832.1 protein-disulfide isomerase [Methylobacterium platani JCM 14648]OAS24155.1 protein-disulfide isomerase [Methylobacterium platani]